MLSYKFNRILCCLILLVVLCGFGERVIYGEQGTTVQVLTRNLAPYDLAKINYLCGNYLQSLLDSRYNSLLFAQDVCGDVNGVGTSIYIDDAGRAIWAFEYPAAISALFRRCFPAEGLFLSCPPA